MTRKATVKSTTPLKRATSSVKKAVSKITSKLSGRKAQSPDVSIHDAITEPIPALPRVTKLTESQPRVARATRREPDIPFDQIEGAYSPTQTSLKAGFRSNGADHHRDQEFARGVDDNRWNDEDRFTNKSGDPRIGTHGRSYEPGEARAASSGKRRE